MKSWHMTCVVNNYYPSFIFNCRLFRRTSRLKTGSTSAILWVLFGPYTTIETTVKLKSLFLYSKPLSFCFILAVRKWAKTYAACKKPNPTQPRWSKHEVTNKFWNDFRFIQSFHFGPQEAVLQSCKNWKMWRNTLTISNLFLFISRQRQVKWSKVLFDDEI